MKKLVISLPNTATTDERHHYAWRAYICSKVNENAKLKHLGLSISDIVTYKTDDTEKGDFKDRGIATVQDYTIDAEKGMVDSIAKAGKLTQNSYLIKDGSSEYLPMTTGKYADIHTFKDSYRWVIGISKCDRGYHSHHVQPRFTKLPL